MYTLKMNLLVFHKNNFHSLFSHYVYAFLVKNGDKIIKLNVCFISLMYVGIFLIFNVFFNNIYLLKW